MFFLTSGFLFWGWARCVLVLGVSCVSLCLLGLLFFHVVCFVVWSGVQFVASRYVVFRRVVFVMYGFLCWVRGCWFLCWVFGVGFVMFAFGLGFVVFVLGLLFDGLV